MRRLVLAVVSATLLAGASSGDAVRERIYPVGGEVKPPIRIKNCDPVIPPSLRGVKITQPFFVYEAVISSKGEVRSVRLVNGRAGKPYALIDESFRNAMRCWRFRPATLHGHAVACRYMLTATVEVR